MKGSRKSAPLIRLGFVVTYAVAAFLLAHLVSGQRTRVTVGPPAAPAASVGQNVLLKIDLKASRPIADWGIALDRIPLENSSLSALAWSTRVPVAIHEGSRLLLDLTPVDSETESPLALRIDISASTGSMSQTLWAPGELVEAVSLDAFCAQPAASP